MLDDAFRYDFEAEEWSAIVLAEAGPRRPPARVGHIIAFAPDGCLRLFGGERGLPSSSLLMTLAPALEAARLFTLQMLLFKHLFKP